MNCTISFPKANTGTFDKMFSADLLVVKNRIYNQLFQRWFLSPWLLHLSFPDLDIEAICRAEHFEYSGVLSNAQECSGILRVLRSPQFGKLLHFPDLENWDGEAMVIKITYEIIDYIFYSLDQAGQLKTFYQMSQYWP